MTYNIEIKAISFDKKCETIVLRAYRITERHLEAMIENVVPKYNPLGHEIIITANITKEEAENERNGIY